MPARSPVVCSRPMVGLPIAHAVTLALGLALAVATPLTAETLDVPGEFPTIQAAIDAAVAGDEVVIADGVYMGPGNRNISFQGKPITVRSANGAMNCTIDAEGVARGFVFDQGETPDAKLLGLTITNGFAASGGAIMMTESFPTIESCRFVANTADLGSAVRSFSIFGGATGVFVNCEFLMNSAATDPDGADALSLEWPAGGEVFLGSCTFTENFGEGFAARGVGGTIDDCHFTSDSIVLFDSCLTISNCVLTGGGIDVSSGGMGCASAGTFIVGCEISGAPLWGISSFAVSLGIDECVISGGLTGLSLVGSVTEISETLLDGNATGVSLLAGSLEIRDSSIVNHQNRGLVQSNGTVVIANSLIQNNGTGPQGGGAETNGAFTAVNCRFIGNHAESGGALFVTGGTSTLTNCIVAGNTALAQGGGVAIESGGALVLSSSTVYANSALAGGGVLVGPGGSLTVHNSILWDNVPDQISESVPGGVEEVRFSDVQGGWPGDGNLDVDPMFVDPLGPDGMAGTDDDDLRLVGSSELVDAGNDGLLPLDVADLDGDGVTTEPTPLDLDLTPRVQDGDDDGSAETDIGAYEASGDPGLPGDLNNDGMVDGADLAILLAEWGPCPAKGLCPADLNGDGTIDGGDLGILLGFWMPVPR